MKKKYVHVSFRIDDSMEGMVQALMLASSYNSRPQVFQEAVRRMYEKKFPSYTGKPTPQPIAGGLNQVTAVARARVQNKQALKQEEANEIIENGKAITRLLSGTVINLTGGIDQVACRYSRLDNSPKTTELNNPMFFREMHDRGIWNDDRPIEQNEKLQEFLMETKFRDLKLDEPEDEIKKKLTHIVSYFNKGIEYGKVLPKEFSAEVLICLFLYLDRYGVEYGDLRETMADAGFPVEYAT